MDELEFYDGAWTGQEIDAGIGLTGTLATALAVVVDGNKAAVSAAVGQYVLVKNSTITSITDGLYTAAQAIPAITAIDATYLTAVSKGGLNDLQSSVIKQGTVTVTATGTWVLVNVYEAFGIQARRVVSVNITDRNSSSGPWFCLWKPSGSQNITVLRINTSGTSLVIANTETTVDVRVNWI